MEMQREFNSDLAFTAKSVDLERSFSSQAVAKCIRSLNAKIQQLSLENTILRGSPDVKETTEREPALEGASGEFELTSLEHQLRTEQHRNSSAHRELSSLRSALKEALSQLRTHSPSYLLEQRQRELDLAKNEIALLRRTVAQQQQEKQVLLQRSQHSECFVHDISQLNDKLLLTLQHSNTSFIAKELRKVNNKYNEVLRVLSV